MENTKKETNIQAVITTDGEYVEYDGKVELEKPTTPNESVKDDSKENKAKKSSGISYYDFYMVNRKQGFRLEELIRKNPTAALIFQHILNKMMYGNELTCSSKLICEKLQISRTTLYRHVKYLEENKYITRYKKGTTTVYAVDKALCLRGKITPPKTK